MKRPETPTAASLRSVANEPETDSRIVEILAGVMRGMGTAPPGVSKCETPDLLGWWFRKDSDGSIEARSFMPPVRDGTASAVRVAMKENRVRCEEILYSELPKGHWVSKWLEKDIQVRWEMWTEEDAEVYVDTRAMALTLASVPGQPTYGEKVACARYAAWKAEDFREWRMDK